jgi:hypothetical protein
MIIRNAPEDVQGGASSMKRSLCGGCFAWGELALRCHHSFLSIKGFPLSVKMHD